MLIPGNIAIQLEESLQVRSRYVLQNVHICTFGPSGPDTGICLLEDVDRGTRRLLVLLQVSRLLLAPLLVADDPMKLVHALAVLLKGSVIAHEFALNSS